MRVLLVDDVESMRMAVARSLRNIDEVESIAEVESAEEALDHLEREPVDLILCDWNLGAMSGIELLEALRAASWNTPFGFITAEFSPASRGRAQAAGAAFVLTKPFTPDELYEAVRGQEEGESPEQGLSAPSTGESLTPADRATQLAALLSTLCGASVVVSRVDTEPELRASRYLACYVGGEDELLACCVLETSVALALAGAMRRFAPRMTQEWAGAGIVPDELRSDLWEVASVLSQFVRDDEQRLILSSVEAAAPGERLGAAAQIQTASTIEHFAIDVAGYCAGCCTVAAL